MGFGRSLHVQLSAETGATLLQKIYYEAVETFVLDKPVVEVLPESLQKWHELPWETKHKINSKLGFLKSKEFFESIRFEKKYNLIYFDAFSRVVQPELWSKTTFNTLYSVLDEEGGVLIPYCSKATCEKQS